MGPTFGDRRGDVGALDQASARTFVEAHPDGLDAVVGDRGIRLSGASVSGWRLRAR